MPDLAKELVIQALGKRCICISNTSFRKKKAHFFFLHVPKG